MRGAEARNIPSARLFSEVATAPRCQCELVRRAARAPPISARRSPRPGWFSPARSPRWSGRRDADLHAHRRARRRVSAGWVQVSLLTNEEGSQARAGRLAVRLLLPPPSACLRQDRRARQRTQRSKATWSPRWSGWSPRWLPAAEPRLPHGRAAVENREPPQAKQVRSRPRRSLYAAMLAFRSPQPTP